MSKRSFGNGTHILACPQGRADLGGGGELPLFLGIQAVGINAALQEPAGLLSQDGQGILQSVIDLAQKTGAQISGQHIAGELHRVAALDAVGHFVDLDLGDVTADTDNLALKCGVADLNEANFVHGNIAAKFDRHQVAVDTYNLTCIFGHHIASNLSPFIMEL